MRLRLTPSAPHPLVSSVHIQVRTFHHLLPSDMLSFSHPAAVVVSCSRYCVFLRLAVFACSILIYFIRSSSWHNYQQHRTGCMGIYISVKKGSTIEKQKIRKKPNLEVKYNLYCLRAETNNSSTLHFFLTFSCGIAVALQSQRHGNL